MNNVLKILIGVVIFLVGVWEMANPVWFGQNGWLCGLNWWIYTWDIIEGALGPVLILYNWINNGLDVQVAYDLLRDYFDVIFGSGRMSQL